MALFTKERTTQYLYSIMQALDEKGGELSLKNLIAELDVRLNLTIEERALNKSNTIRWVKVMQFASIGLVKVGWIKKNKGIWYLTDEGREALQSEPSKFRAALDKKYEEWAAANNAVSPSPSPAPAIEDLIEAADSREIRSFDEAEADAREEIKSYIQALNPYAFQDLVAALFRGMGYFTPFIAPKGPDGGIDIVAYKDAIGAESPRIRVQVKHRMDAKVTRAEIQALKGNLDKDGYVGVIVSTGGFTSDSIVEVRTSRQQIEKIDLDDFMNLWEQHYEKLSDEDKRFLPLRRINFLAPEG